MIEIREDSITPELAAQARRLRDTRPVLEAMGMAVESLAKQAFVQPAARPAPWAPLKPATLRAKAKAGKSSAILHASTLLSKSVRIQEPIGRESVTIVSDRDYAAIQQLGSRKTSGRGSGIPPRPFLPWAPGGEMSERGKLAVERAVRAVLRLNG